MAVRLTKLAKLIWLARFAATRRSIQPEQLLLLVAKVGAGIAAAAAVGGLTASVPLDQAYAVARLAAVANFLAWLLIPLLSGGGNEAVRPEHLTYFPHPPARLSRALVLSQAGGGGSAVIALGSLPTLILGVRLIFGVRLGGPTLVAAAGVAVAVMAAVLQALLVFLASRTLLTALSGFLRSRTGRVAGSAVLVVIGLGIAFGLRSIVESVQRPGVDLSSVALNRAVGAVPSSWTVDLVALSARGQWGSLLGLVAAVLTFIAGLAVVLDRLTRGRIAHPVWVSTVGPVRRASTLWRWAPDTPACAVARAELALWVRDPRRRVTMAMTAVFLPATIGPALSGWTVLLPFTGLAMIVYLAAETSNLYGLEPRTLITTLTVPGGVSADVSGKQLAWLLLTAPFALVTTVAAVSIDGDSTRALWALSLAPAVLGGTAGILVALSAYGPARLPDNAEANPFTMSLNPHHAQLAFTPLLVAVLVPPLALLLVGLLGGLPALTWLAVPTGVLTGVLGWASGRRVAIRRLNSHGAGVLATVA